MLSPNKTCLFFFLLKNKIQLPRLNQNVEDHEIHYFTFAYAGRKVHEIFTNIMSHTKENFLI